jgi:putative ABC transport system permease protein
MFNTLWIKALRDLWVDRSRTLLVILSIAIGVFGAGLVADTYAVLSREMDKNYQNTTPASATLWLDQVDDSLVNQVRALPAIKQAEARRMVVGRIQVGQSEWKEIWLFVANDYQKLALDTFSPDSGVYPPGSGQILLERAALTLARAKLDQTVQVRLPEGQELSLTVAGTVHAPGLAPAWMEGFAYGYISQETLQVLGARPGMDQLKIQVAQNAMDQSAIRSTVNDLKGWLEQNGRKVYRFEIPKPGRHPHASQMDTLLFLLEAFGFLALILSGVLVANMISALLSQQIRQIGVMKALGARARQVAQIYFASVLVLGLAGSLVGIPLALQAGRAYASFSAQMLNFTIFDNSIPWWAFAFQVAVGLCVPLLVALSPVLRGSRISVREALGDYGINGQEAEQSLFDGWLGQVGGASRVILLALRNTFRRKARLLLTLGTLAAGGAGFIVAMNVSASMNYTVDLKFDAFRYDMLVRFSQPYPEELIERTLSGQAGVKGLESWGGAKAAVMYPDGTSGNTFNLVAPPLQSQLITQLPVLEGRWLQPGDTDALVVNHALLKNEPSLRIGEKMTLRINGQESTWRLVGVVQEIMSQPAAYVPKNYFTAAVGQQGLAQNVVLVASQRDSGFVAVTARGVEQTLAGAGLKVADLSRLADMRKAIEDHLLLLASFLVMMSVLVLVVGGMGLANTMSINVMERRRELGVLRAMGASTWVVMQVVLSEAVVIGVLSWVAAVLASYPISSWISVNFGQIFFEAPLQFAVSVPGMAAWLGIVMVFSALASFYPAWGTAQEPVHEVLAYE